MAQSIATSIQKLQTALANDKTQLANKGVTVPSNTKHSDIPNLIKGVNQHTAIVNFINNHDTKTYSGGFDLYNLDLEQNQAGTVTINSTGYKVYGVTPGRYRVSLTSGSGYNHTTMYVKSPINICDNTEIALGFWRVNIMVLQGTSKTYVPMYVNAGKRSTDNINNGIANGWHTYRVDFRYRYTQATQYEFILSNTSNSNDNLYLVVPIASKPAVTNILIDIPNNRWEGMTQTYDDYVEWKSYGTLKSTPTL